MSVVKCYSWKDVDSRILLKVALDHKLHLDPANYVLMETMERLVKQTNQQVALLTVNDIPVGVTLIRGNLYMFYVHPEHRRKGYGTLMYNTLVKDHMARMVVAETYGHPPTDGASCFFARIGLEEFETKIRRERAEFLSQQHIRNAA